LQIALYKSITQVAPLEAASIILPTVAIYLRRQNQIQPQASKIIMNFFSKKPTPKEAAREAKREARKEVRVRCTCTRFLNCFCFSCFN
jgi:hypothetical protein